MGRGKSYTREFKITACELVTNNGIKTSVVAEKFAINEVMLYRWVSEYKEQGKDAFVGTGHLKPADAELKKLQKENERLKMENEILKKAAAYFAKKPSGE